MIPTPDPRCSGPLPALGRSRRELLARFGLGLGSVALAHLLCPPRARAAGDSGADGRAPAAAGEESRTGRFDVAPRARRVIYLFMAGGPSQLETFDPKPLLNARNGEDLPESVRRGQ